jgi:N-formylglutamate deformylase
MSEELFCFRQGAGPLVVSCPHAGTIVPDAIAARMTEAGRSLSDTDWNVDKLYDFLPEFDATFIAANPSRYVADLNRDPKSTPLYPGRFETAMCPAITFAGDPIYQSGKELTAVEIAERHAHYWQPYHTKLTEILVATKKRHGFALLLDAHSILSQVPKLFEGRLPDLNLGTADGKSCSAGIQTVAVGALNRSQFSFVTNGRFKGGFITRHYGNPAGHVHAMQLEISICTYGNENDPSVYEPERAGPLRKVLRGFISALREHQAVPRP